MQEVMYHSKSKPMVEKIAITAFQQVTQDQKIVK